jgi:hypothetical protein
MVGLTSAPAGTRPLVPPRRLFGGAAGIDDASGEWSRPPAAPTQEGPAIAPRATAPPPVPRSAAGQKRAPAPHDAPALNPTGVPPLATGPAAPGDGRGPAHGAVPDVPGVAHPASPSDWTGTAPQRVPVSFLDPLWDEPVALQGRSPAPRARGDAGEERDGVGRPDGTQRAGVGPAPAVARTSPAASSPAPEAPHPDPESAPPAPPRSEPQAPAGAARRGSGEPTGRGPLAAHDAIGASSAAANADPAVPAGTRPGSAASPTLDLIPPAAPSRDASQVGQRNARQDLPRAEPERVSIGTIEVTVVAPAKPRAVSSRPAPRWQRPPSRLAGTDRLKDGRRRWYGIAQG